MTLQIRSRIANLVTTDILVLLLHSNVILKCSLFDGYKIRYDENSEIAYCLLGHPVYTLPSHPVTLLPFVAISLICQQ